MSFDPSRYPNAVTIGDLIDQRLGLGVHCLKCARHVVIDAATLSFDRETPVPSLGGRFKCTRFGSTNTEARPEWPRR